MIDLENYEDLLLTDKEGTIVFCDLSNYDFFDIRPDDIIGKKSYDLHKNLNNSNSTIMQVLKEGEPLVGIEEKLITNKGREVYQKCTILPLKINGIVVGSIELSSCIYDKSSIINTRTHSSNKIYRKNHTIYTVNDIISKSDKMNLIKKDLLMISETDSSVLIYGETGTGKEMIAQSIHNLGYRFSKPFISQNCAAIPETLFESILFGTEAGSFTGSVSRKGLFELAEGGTLFLDEINSVPSYIQTKLLKAIEEKQVRRIGGVDAISVDVRIIAASNENSEYLLKNHLMRKDFFYRLSVVSIEIPPLRERREDIIPLLNYFIGFYNERMKRRASKISDEVKIVLMSYDWPGNIRELKYMIEGIFNKSNSEEIILEDIPDEIRNYKEKVPGNSDNTKTSLREIMETYEKSIILDNIRLSSSLSEAARNMKISRQALNYKLNKYDIDVDL